MKLRSGRIVEFPDLDELRSMDSDSDIDSDLDSYMGDNRAYMDYIVRRYRTFIAVEDTYDRDCAGGWIEYSRVITELYHALNYYFDSVIYGVSEDILEIFRLFRSKANRITYSFSRATREFSFSEKEYAVLSAMMDEIDTYVAIADGL